MTVSLITGANKGLGFATVHRLVAEGHTVYAGARDPELGAAAAARSGARFVQLDVTDDASVAAAMKVIEEREGHLDVLVNNAGIFDGVVDADGVTAHGATEQFATNTVGAVRVTQAALPLLHRSANPVVVNVSSKLGAFATVTDPSAFQSGVHSIVYSASKAALGMLTVRYAQAVPNVKFNAVSPGFLATDLHGDTSGDDPAAGAEVVARLATIGIDGPTGTFQDRTGEIPW
jgi:NAD(P)-dependent dehydrogenase (short-subunit alcohol dehydrogenase family)